MILFVTGTGTDVGKTHVTRALLQRLHQQGVDAVGLKPIETGVGPEGPQDALALDLATGADYAHHPSFYRAVPALGPMAIASPPLPRLEALAEAIQTIAAQHTLTLVEGAGGPLVPLRALEDGGWECIVDLAVRLEAPVLLVVKDELGCLSHTLTAVESIRARGLELRHVVLNRIGEGDASSSTNEHDLRRLGLPLLDPQTEFDSLLRS